MNDRGSVTVVWMAIVVLLVAAGMVVATVGQTLVAYGRVATAADAAALAAAPVTFRAFGELVGPAAVASRFAVLNGARLVSCDCRVDRSWNRRIVATVAEVDVDLVGLGHRRIRAQGRAEFDPVRLIAGSGGEGG